MCEKERGEDEGRERESEDGRERERKRERDSDHKLTTIPFLVQVLKGSMHDCKCTCVFYIPTISYVFTVLVGKSHNLCI